MSGLLGSNWTRTVSIPFLALALMLGACRDSSSTAGDATGPGRAQLPVDGDSASIVDLGIKPESTTVAVGATVTLTATAYNARNVAVPAVFQWFSWVPEIATVDGAGAVHGVAPGRAVVRATAGTHFAQATVIVLAAGGGDEGGPPQATRVTVSPRTPSVMVGATVELAATVYDQNGQVMGAVPVSWTSLDAGIATVSTSGLVAGIGAGTAHIVASAAAGVNDTALVTVTAPPPPAPPPQATRVTVSPRTPSVMVGATVQLTATVYDQNGQLMGGAPVSWSSLDAGIAAVSASGVVTGVAAGTARVRASAAAGVNDTASVTVTAAPAPPPPSQPPPPSGGSYARSLGDDWQSYADDAALDARQYFYWVDAAGRNVNDFVTLVSDPTFGKAVRITFPQNTGSPGSSPRLAADLPGPLDRVWYRWRMKFTPGWTTVGPDPAGSANSYKIAFWLWQGLGGRGELEYSNTSEYVVGTGMQDASGAFLRYTETPLAGSAASFGNASTEWSDGEWWEFVVYYQKTGPTSARQYYWRRRLTTGGKLVDNPWIFYGWEMTGNTTPQVSGIELGINKNKNNPTDMFITWGPWEVVDGSRYPNPFGMPNVQP